MEKYINLYTKALNCYQQGRLEKALELCELSISSNLRYTAALNLKGLLLYLKGDLEGARVMWSINKDMNKDEVSKKYLEDSKKDEERKQIYDTAVELIKNVRIKEAVELLRLCEESDFNSINVNNAIAGCLIKQGKYEEAARNIDKVLGIDVYNREALDNRKMLKDFGISANKACTKRAFFLAAGVTGVLAITLVCAFVLSKGSNSTGNSKKDFTAIISSIFNNISSSDKGITNTGNSSAKQEAPKTDEGKNHEAAKEKIKDSVDKSGTQNAGGIDTPKAGSETPKAYGNSDTAPDFPQGAIKQAIDGKDYEVLYSHAESWKDKKLGINDAAILSKAVEVLKNQGVEHFYSKGRDQAKNGEFAHARANYQKACAYGREHYLYPHALYFQAAASEKLNDIENALKLYESYASLYSNGDYAEEAYYNLAMLYKNLDAGKAKEYARIIVTRFPGRMYDNSNMRDILNKQ